MSQLVAMFCDMDDFCKTFEPIYTERLLQSGQRQRTRHSQLSLRPDFPALVSHPRFVELMPRALVPLCTYLHTRKGRCTGITFVDSTPLAGCPNKRRLRHRVFDGYASHGKSSMGGYVGFKLHWRINDEGELLGVRVPPGEYQSDRALASPEFEWVHDQCGGGSDGLH